jgi:phosphoglycolate phosphatase
VVVPEKSAEDVMGFGGIIFDCDGVLFESRRANLAYYNMVLDKMGETPVSEQDGDRAHLCHTAATPQVLETLLGPQRLSEGLAIAAAIDYRRLVPFMIPEPGMKEALARLSIHIPLAVATNRGSSIGQILEFFELGRYFRAVVTSRDVSCPKPHPDMLLLAARRLETQERDLLFVGDSELDREAARGAGIRFVAYKGSVDGDYHVNSFQELMALIMAEPGPS